jgi:hypothetical protein
MQYNLGRTTTYATGGIIFGIAGKGLALANLQQHFSIALGSLMVLSVFVPMLNRQFNTIQPRFFSTFSLLKSTFRKYMTADKKGALYIIGLLNGLLPCGMVYLAIAGSLLTNSPLEGALYMAFFGLGTIPIMTLISIGQYPVSARFKKKAAQFIPTLIVFFGVLFILRGLNLEIPYLSPSLHHSLENTTSCY